MGYSEALEMQVTLREAWQSVKGMSWFNWLASHNDLGDDATEAEYDRYGKMSYDLAMHALHYGDTFYLSREIEQLVAGSCRTLPMFELSPDLFPSTSGFLWLERPLDKYFHVQSESGNPECVGYFWNKTKVASKDNLADVLGRGWAVGVISSRDDLIEPELPARPTAVLNWWLGESWTIVAERMKEEGFTELGIFQWQFLMASFAFMRERLFVSPPQQVDRGTRRRLDHDRVVIEPVVRVIELRKREYAHSTEAAERGSADYSCKWMVRGHWRRQWYPSLQRHQPKWITPYVKGPEDKPLKPPRATVFAVVR